MNRQSLPVRPEIFERLTVVQLNVRGHGFLDCIRNDGLLRGKRLTVKGQGPASPGSCPRPQSPWVNP
jgi:hypothetical protein